MKCKVKILISFILIACCPLQQELSAQYQIQGWYFGGGGGDASNEDVTLRSSAGQPLIGVTIDDELGLRSGFWYLGEAAVLTSVEEQKAAELPVVFSLDQNYPNPFNPTTTIRFALPEETEVELAVYDLLGRKVTTLVDGRNSAGTYEVIFEAGNLASGTYIYRLQADDFIKSKQLTLIK